MNKKQSGSAHVIIIALLVIALIGTLGFVYWQNFMQTKDNDNNQSISKDTAKDTSKDTTEASDTTPKSTNEGYLVLEDWGVKFKLPTDLGDNNVTYQKMTGQSFEGYDFSTSRVEAQGGNCVPTSQFYVSLGGLTRSTENSSGSIAKIGDYYYYYSSPQASCNSDGNTTIQEQDSNILKTMILSIEEK